MKSLAAPPPRHVDMVPAVATPPPGPSLDPYKAITKAMRATCEPPYKAPPAALLSAPDIAPTTPHLKAPPIWLTVNNPPAHIPPSAASAPMAKTPPGHITAPPAKAAPMVEAPPEAPPGLVSVPATTPPRARSTTNCGPVHVLRSQPPPSHHHRDHQPHRLRGAHSIANTKLWRHTRKPV